MRTEEPTTLRNRIVHASDVIDRWLLRVGTTEHRLIGLSILRLVVGVCGVEYYVSDLGHRDMLWGPNAYISIADARGTLPEPLTSLYFWSHSELWFNAVFFVGLAVAALFTVYGGRGLTFVHLIFMWSIYDRNQDVLEGGDNLVRIILIFMVFAVTNRYLTPRSKSLRKRSFAPAHRPQWRYLSTSAHNIAATLIVFQVVVVYAVAGYYKLTGSMWNTGVAAYYVSHINQFTMFGLYPSAMNNLWLGWFVSTFTIVVECAVPFVIVTRRRWLREMVVAGLESMHVGIIVCMGLVAFGLIMIGADFTLLKDSDYRNLGARVRRIRQRRRRAATGTPVADETTAQERPKVLAHATATVAR
ncbi:hypothetical protein [Williamsia sp.]|uniref:hypothetical protein n=1 Tax=Williamsia sp. TaxID=1872085 RepID=UPI001A31413E|nr:hypothetical protein [Williamsia sp.]MBJ7291752.1 hypothetical protein [Williamsia sp.]